MNQAHARHRGHCCRSDLCRTFESLNLGSFWATDADGRITYVSANAEQVLANDQTILGKPFVELFTAPENGEDRQRTLTFAFVRKLRFDRIIVSTGGEANRRWWSISGEAQQDKGGNFTGFKGHLADVTSERKSAEESSALAMNDPLTGLLNRRHMAQLLERTITAYASQRRPCATMFIDLDRFKQINDTLGHPVGDALLKQVAERLVRSVGAKDEECRQGGDEFQVVLPDVDDRGRLGDLASSIITSLSEPYSIEGNRCLIGASIGVAVSPFDGENADELVRNADLALYAAKRDGRGRFRFYSSDLLKTAENRKQLEEDLHDALPKDELCLVYQPIVDTKTNRVTGAETLVRWDHPDLGAISPAQFIPIAEESGLIVPLGTWVLKRALAQVKAWHDQGLGWIKVSVNVSAGQFWKLDLPQLVADLLAEADVPPHVLDLELTERVAMINADEGVSICQRLKDVGVTLSMDDFGTGYSSLSYLSRLPMDVLKIDQSFVRRLGENEQDEQIVRSVVQLAHSLSLQTVAEGVETPAQLAFLKALGCDQGQGYWFARPMPPLLFEAWMQQHQPD